MNADGGIAAILTALALPADALVEQRIPKKLLLEQSAPKPADKRLIQDGIEDLTWFAALKPTNIGVPACRDEIREYIEIAVIAAELRGPAKPSRLAGLIHRAIPYPVVLVTARDESVGLSLAHKRWSQAEAGAVIVEETLGTSEFRPDAPSQHEAAFLASLALSEMHARDLFTLYQGWMDRVIALQAAAITKTFALPESADGARVRREALADYDRLTREIVSLRARAQKETQINRRVELNLAIKSLEAKLAEAVKLL